MPVGYILVCDTRCDIKHDDTALSVNVVSITKTAKLLLTGSIPDVELNLAQVLLKIRQRSFSQSQRSRLQGYLPWQSQEDGPQHRELRYTSSRTHQSNGA